MLQMLEWSSIVNIKETRQEEDGELELGNKNIKFFLLHKWELKIFFLLIFKH